MHLAHRGIAKLVGAGVLTLSLTGLSAIALPLVASAHSWTVSNCNDSGAGSLRTAVSDAGPNDTVVLGSGCPVITLTTGPIAIATNLKVKGPGAADLAVSGGGSSTVFWIGGSAKVTISGITIEDGVGSLGVPHGPTSNGGGIFNFGVLTVEDTTVTNNAAVYGYGGGIYNAGTLTVKSSTLSDNNAGEAWGAVYNSCCRATIAHTTLSGNVAGFAGGALYNGTSAGSSLTVTYATLTGNSSTYGSAGGVYNYGAVTVTHSSLAENTAVLDAGAIESDSGSVSIKASSLAGNTDFSGDVDPGIYILGGTLTVKGTTVS